MPDPRARRGRRHSVGALVAVALCAVLTGARGFTAIAEWAGDAGRVRLARLGMVRRAADESTFRRVLSRLDPTALEEALGAWAVTRARKTGGRRVYAIDGKAVRGARKKGAARAFLVAALDHVTGTVAAQVGVEAKGSEITAARVLLGLLDLTGAVLTLDALHTNKTTAAQIVTAGAHYVFTVKGNSRVLFAMLKALPWALIPATTSTDRGHGRRATRTIKVLDAPAWIEFTGAAQVAQLRRTITVKGKKTVEVVYLVTSAGARIADPATLATWANGQWSIENRLHWVRDITFDEDPCQIHTGHAPQNMAALHNTAIAILRTTGWNNIAAALRHHARDVNRPVHTLLQA
ncbi:ISAs1 family transposase [Myceligenerans sp. I2]|uniref:ISAs1 family transposase n=1 Tax=Myceligenerans indicum TaxID=2593663 RepID=A0ABS1LLA5_9MICO|nr:ISAs1 family transposase [Myceligenerans indicum]